MGLTTSVGCWAALYNRAFFTWVSKQICICLGFALLRQAIGLKISRHFVLQSDVKPKQNRNLLAHVFEASRFLRTFICLKFWLVSDFFGCGFATLNWKLL